MRILVTGGSGQLGTALAPVLEQRGHDAVLLDLEHMDVTDPLATEGVLRSAGPDAVIHAAAWTDVDGCELDPPRARRVIVEGTRNVVLGAFRALVIVVSSDFVFDGEAGRAYDETDETGPLQVYGAAKLESEQLALELSGRVAIARTAWLYAPRIASGESPSNFVTAILRNAEAGPLDVVGDQVGSPTSALDLAPALVDLAEARATGLYHVANRGEVSRATFAREILRHAGLDPALVREVTTADMPPRPARRPAFAPLEGKAWRKAGFDDMPPWEDALERTMRELLA